MEKGGIISCDGNKAAAHVAYAFSDISFLFPITPATSMGEITDSWASTGRKNVFNQVVEVCQMQSEAGVAGSIHGATAVGASVATYTCSQGLMLFLPNMFKIAGELAPCVMHVASRAVGGHALTIHCDHNDVMSVRAAGWAILNSQSTQEAADMALVSHIATFKSRLPFLHFFDGFRTSHEITKVDLPSYEVMSKLVPWTELQQHRSRALNPQHPHVRGTIDGSDIFMQIEERSNEFYLNAPKIVEEVMREVEVAIGRSYHCFDYYGHPEADRIIVVMGAAGLTVEETLDFMMKQDPSQKLGLIKVRLFRPWSTELFVKAIPKTVKSIAVLERTKEPGASGEPMYLDVLSAYENVEHAPYIVGGRFGLGGKEFTPACVKAVYSNLSLPKPRNHFTVGINDDVTHLSLAMEPEPTGVIPSSTVQSLFFGLGSDGTVGSNQDAIKIIGDNTPLNVQGYFFYDAHKSGGLTVSHLRFGKEKIKSEYLIFDADYCACHLGSYVRKYDMAKYVKQNGIFCVNCPWTDAEIEKNFPAKMKRTIMKKNLQLWAIDASEIADAVGLGKRINTVMQVAFFRLSGVLPFEQALELLKNSVRNTYKIKGQVVIDMNIKAIDQSVAALRRVNYPASWAEALDDPAVLEAEAKIQAESDIGAPKFALDISRPSALMDGDSLPVSAFDAADPNPLNLTKYEKRGMAPVIPSWDADKCTQCNECSMFCPHAVIRPFLLTPEEATEAGFPTAPGRGKTAAYRFRIQISSMDCTGCSVCATSCRAKALTMQPFPLHAEEQAKNWRYVMKLPNRADVFGLRQTTIGSQYQQPLLEFSGACDGCGETPYVKMLTQLYGERMVIANASGCSSVWGGTTGSIPYATNPNGHGPAWGNSLFEDNAEYGLGMARANFQRRERLALICKDAAADDKISQPLRDLLTRWTVEMNDTDKCQALTRELVPAVEAEWEKTHAEALKEVYNNRDQFLKLSFWIIGGDGWAYDINYGGIDHVVSLGYKVNIMVMDTEIYSNTGGQKSKSTNLGAIAKFAAGGNRKLKKDLGLLIMSYGDVYVASISLHANPTQAMRAFTEAEAYPGTSVILAYAPCKEHGFPMSKIVEEAKAAVESGYWPLYRYDPRKTPALQLDNKTIKGNVKDFLMRENRYASLSRQDGPLSQQLFDSLEASKKAHHERLVKMSTAALKEGLAAAGTTDKK